MGGAGLERGAPPDADLVDVFGTLFSQVAAQYAYDELRKRDQLAQAITGQPGPDLWRAWLRASADVAKGRPLEAHAHLQSITAIHPVPSGRGGIVEAEILTLQAEYLASGSQTLAAVAVIDHARSCLHTIVRRLREGDDDVQAEVRQMVEILAGVSLREREAGKALGAWAATRGLGLIIKLAQVYAGLGSSAHLAGAGAAAAKGLEDDAVSLHEASGVAFPVASIANLDFALGNCLTEERPDLARAHFDAVADRLGVEGGLGLAAAVNAANCLLRLDQFAEAEYRYGALESIFEMTGDLQGAARVWISECIANWKRTRDPGIRHHLVGAIKLFEESIPASADIMTLYSYKRLAEPGYLLLITANAMAADRSDPRLDELLAALWAVMTRDRRANLEAGADGDEWARLLGQEQRPLAAVRTALQPYPGLGVVHLVSGVDHLIWLIYGFDREGRFRFGCSVADAEASEQLIAFLGTMHEQLEADKALDPVATGRFGTRLEELGDRIGASLSPEWLEVLGSMERLLYMPHPFGNVDEFPLGAVRVQGTWLAELRPIVRTPTVSHLRELLSPNRPGVRRNDRAAVVLGAPDIGGPPLRGAAVQAPMAARYLQVLGFQAVVDERPTEDGVFSLLNGSAGALHYIGHGIADQVFEELPLGGGEHFDPNTADRLDGFTVPFLFFCACVAARVRYGGGGHSLGLLSKLIERGAPAGVAFALPIPEARAYAVAKQFYKAAFRLPMGPAALETVLALRAAHPAYVWLSFNLYGDPDFLLPSVPKGDVPLLSGSVAVWHAKLRSYCVLRTEAAEAELRAALVKAPDDLGRVTLAWLDRGLGRGRPPGDATLGEWEAATLASAASAIERLSVRAAILAERLHQSGVETLPLRIPTAAPQIRQLFEAARFLAFLGGAAFDMPLNGLGNSLLGRVLTVDRNGIDVSELYLSQALEKLAVWEDRSPFVRELRSGDRAILDHFASSP